MTSNDPRSVLARHGYTATGEEWAGMEGRVFALAGGLVAKAWYSASPDDLRELADFSASLRVPFAIPAVVDVLEIPVLSSPEAAAGSTVISVERRVPGTPLGEELDVMDERSVDRAMGMTLEALEALATCPRPEREPATVPVLGYRLGGRTGLPGLLELARRRWEDSRSVLGRSVPNGEEMLAELGSGLSAAPEVLAHGDVCPPNVMVDSARFAGLIDWGFLSKWAPAAFDVAIATSTLDMYSPRARATDDRFTERACARLGTDLGELLRYRALYALLTATIYSPDGEDGHFRWCAGMLRRDDVREAVLG